MRVIYEHVTRPDHSLKFQRFEVKAFRAERHRHRPLAERASRGLQVSGAAAREVTDVLVSMAAADRYGQLAGLVRILGTLSRHPRDLMAIAASPMRTGTQAGSERRIDRVTEWVDRNSISHFNRQFRRRLALTPWQYRRSG